MESLITILSILSFLVVVTFGDSLYKRLDRPGYIRIMQIICWLATIMTVPFIIITAHQSSHFIDSIIYHASISFRDIFRATTSLIMVVFMIINFLKFQLYYMRYDRKTILSGWYMNNYFSLFKEQKYNEAYQYLQKANETYPDSVYLWCCLASFNEVICDNSIQCDSYLAKAKEVLNSSRQPTDREKAVYECYNGYVQRHRGNLQQSLEYMKKAYDFEPTPFRKGEYEKAVEMVNTNSSDSYKTQ
jgi:tetratricopeptide (TPR) repeat protein